MKKLTSTVLLLAGLTFVHAADKYAPAGNTLTDRLQWLAVQTACLSQYGYSFAGEFVQPDPRDIYVPSDIREYLANRSGGRTSISTVYGICFDYAQYAYNLISNNQGDFPGVREWYIAGVYGNSRQIVLFDPVPRGQHDVVQNGVYVKTASRQNVQTHSNATFHAWLWVYGNDGTIYWIDPTWTDGSGYVCWGVVRNGREEQIAPNLRFCAVRPPSGEAFVSLTSGDAKRTEGKHTEAIEEYNKAIEVEPNYAVIYNNRGRSYYAKGDYDRAIADYNQAITLDPKYADAFNNRGLAYYAKRDLDRALADYTQAITLNPEFALAYDGRAYVYLAKKEYRTAMLDNNQAIKLWPREAAWFVTRGEILLEAGSKKDVVIEQFETALRMSPGYTRAKELLQIARKRR